MELCVYGCDKSPARPTAMPTGTLGMAGISAPLPRTPGVTPPGQDPKEDAKARKAARDFEAIFVQQMLDQMEKTIDRTDSLLNGGEAESTWRGVLHQHMAQNIANRPGGSGFGLAESIYRQITKESYSTPAVSSSPQATTALSGVEKQT
jgi:peptidoglycan hydrolase FlgJ